MCGLVVSSATNLDSKVLDTPRMATDTLWPRVGVWRCIPDTSSVSGALECAKRAGRCGGLFAVAGVAMVVEREKREREG